VTEVLFEGARAVGVAYTDRTGQRREVASKVVVDATGRSTLLAGHLKRRYANPKLRKAAFYTHFRGADWRANDDGSTVTDIHATDGGWLWCIPLRDRVTSIGLVVDGAFLKARGEQTPEELFQAAIAGNAEFAAWLAGAEQTMPLHRVPSISYLNDDFVGDGFVMIGDAALFVDPIFSAGVTIATRAGDFAADVISAALKAGDTSAAAFKPYEEKIRQPIEKIGKMIVNWYKIMEHGDRSNIFEWTRRMPALRERLVVLLSGGYDKVDLDAIQNWI
jgi:halogenation protein CepH